MKAYVEERNEVVRVEGQSWPFQLDCRAGTLTVILEGGPVRLRPYSWREKRNLARFTHLGEGFLKNQFLRLSLVGEESLPENEVSREALWALARWLNGPQGNSGLPLDQGLLATVTFELCRSMGLSPAALDDLEAAEVEALWQAAGGERRRAGDSAAGTRILVIPDPESQGPLVTHPFEAQDRPEAEEKSAAASRNPDSPPESGAAAPGREEPEAASPHAREALSPKAVSPPQASRAGDPAREPDPVRAGIQPAPGPKGEPLTGPQGRFRVVRGTAPTDLAGRGAVPRSPTRPEISLPAGRDKVAAPAAAAPGRAGATERPAAVWLHNPSAAASGSPSPVAALQPAADGFPAPPPMPALASVQGEPFPAETPPQLGPEREGAAGDELENLLDEFADRLEAAAGAMGIDLEP